MREVLKILTTTCVALATSVVGCTLFQGSSNNGGGGSGNSTSANGGSTIGVGSGGSPSTAGNAGNAGTAGNSSNAGSTGMACATLTGIDSTCGGTQVSAQFKTVNMMLVLDKSLSMNDVPDGFSTDKWSALKQALGTALTNVQNDINFGMIMFPYATGVADSDINCQLDTSGAAVNVPVSSGGESVPSILQTLNNTNPSGGTPTAAALQAAYDYFTGPGLTVAGDKFVLLATDGAPNCNTSLNCGADGTHCTSYLSHDPACSGPMCCAPDARLCLDDQSVVQVIQQLANKGIPTFVVGIPGTEAFSTYLDAFAVAGGEANPDPNSATKYYAVSAMGGVQGLVDVFSTITTQLVRSCDIALGSQPPDLTKVNVAVDCTVVPQTAADGSMAWELDVSSSPGTLRFLGSTCDQIKSQGAKRVDTVFGCPTLK